jgi:hypothetical protein
LHPVVRQKFHNISAVLAASIIRVTIMEAARIPETLVNFCHGTQGNKPEDSHLHDDHHKDLKSHLI